MLSLRQSIRNTISRTSRDLSMRQFSSKIGIVGSGQMGTGIAYVLSRVGNKQVTVYDANQAQLKNSEKFIAKLLDKEIAKSKITGEQKAEVLGRFKFTQDLQAFESSDFIIEAIVEDFEVKRDLFRKLDKIARRETIIASNTSSISITKLGATVNRPDRIIGMHFMNPVPVMKLVEVIKGLATSEETHRETSNLIREIAKEEVVSQDFPGFIINRILIPMINEAVFVLQEGIASKEDIDKGMKLGTNVPMGPLTLADFIGLDTVLFVLNVLHGEIKDPKFRPCPLLVNYVSAGWLGRKSGKGFYEYK